MTSIGRRLVSKIFKLHFQACLTTELKSTKQIVDNHKENYMKQLTFRHKLQTWAELSFISSNLFCNSVRFYHFGHRLWFGVAKIVPFLLKNLESLLQLALWVELRGPDTHKGYSPHSGAPDPQFDFWFHIYGSSDASWI